MDSTIKNLSSRKFQNHTDLWWVPLNTDGGTDMNYMKSYGPISLKKTLAKIFKRIIVKQIHWLGAW